MRTYVSTFTGVPPLVCTDCGVSIPVIGTRSASLIRHMINAGEISVGEARAELHSGFQLPDVAEELAGWILARSDQGDGWRAGDPVTLPCGCRVSYDGEQLDLQDGCAADHRPALHVPC